MAYADVTNPIKITLSQSSAATLDNYLRRMCIVSGGDTNLENNEFKEVYASNYTEILRNTSGELANKLKGFFAFASSKPVIVLECGAGNISEQVENLRNFISNGKSKSYMHLVLDSWYYPEAEMSVSDEDKAGLYMSYTSLSFAKGASIALSDILYNGEIAFTQGDTFADNFSFDESTKTITCLEGATESATGTLSLKITLGNEVIAQDLTLKALAEGSETIKEGGFTQNYALKRDTSFANLASEFISTESNTYFIIKSDNGLSDSDSWALYKDKKCVFAIYDNLTTAYPLSSVALGLMAGSHYDLSATQKATPLNNKSINGVSYNELSQTLMNDLTQQPLNFAGDFAGTTVLFNGRYAGGDTWEYLYQSDFMIYAVESAIATLLLNSANNTNYVLQFNQNGIDVLNATVKGALDNLVSLGVISDYGTNFNVTTNLIENSGYVYTMDFATYKANYTENYNNEIYNGLSFAVQIGRYIKQINIAISRG